MQTTATASGGDLHATNQILVPLCVDLDGTLLKTDLLWESALGLVKRDPGALAKAPFWLLSGRANLKRRLAELAALDVALLPYRDEVLELIATERARGRRIVLVSAADETFAQAVAAHLGCFDEVIASDGRRNLKGTVKRDALVQRFGEKGFDYVGDHAADLRVWEAARAGHIISSNRRLLRRADVLGIVTPLKTPQSSLWKTWGRALRLHQWSKNVLVLVPVITSHRITEPGILFAAAVAFFAFSFVSSSVYLVNDLVDLEADRGHKRKRTRAFSAGVLPLRNGVAAAAVLLLTGLALGLMAGGPFVGMLLAYFGCSFAYSAYLKRISGLDVLILAGFYTLRIFSGGSATGIGVSVWLLAFSMFFFFSLALIKRYSELRSDDDEEPRPVQSTGRGYVASDLPTLGAFGVTSGFISVLVLVLYVMSEEVTLLYAHPDRLLLICPLLLYWISRMWLRTTRGQMHEDPVVFALTDRISYLLGVLAGVAVVFATV
jgi:4-hydroxybenzoate polyprenyltransferase/phosphoserine phosphatase